MKRSYIGLSIFGFFMVTMVCSGISFAFFTIGKGDNAWFAATSVFALFISVYLGMVKTPEWFGGSIDPALDKD